jgi:hypothetical protein
MIVNPASNNNGVRDRKPNRKAEPTGRLIERPACAVLAHRTIEIAPFHRAPACYRAGM